MPDIFDSIFGGEGQSTLGVGLFLLCIAISLLAGAIYAAVSLYRCRGERSLAVALFFLPTVVAVTVMAVNGNIGIGVAVAGAFSLVRFRSAPGTARQIAVLFMAMCTGLLAGVGYLAYALLFTLVTGGLYLLIAWLAAGREDADRDRILRITIPEDLEYEGALKDILDTYTEAYTLTQVRTSDLGSLYKLRYRVTLRKGADEKAMIDSLRVRNGNLEIALSHAEEDSTVL